MGGISIRLSDAFGIKERDAASPGGDGHYLGLDFLRGVAALGVLGVHFAGRMAMPDAFSHAYLAVDFFFVLSGFVVAHAYSARLAQGKMSLAAFFKVRIVRLEPLIVLGTVMALVTEIGRPDVLHQSQHLADSLRTFVFGCFLIPSLSASTVGFAVFPLDQPVWSLFFEAIANVAFAVWASKRWGFSPIRLLMAASAIILLWSAVHANATNFGWEPASFLLGFPRVVWSFGIGLLLYRVRDLAPKVSIVLPTVMLIAMMIVPRLHHLAWVFDAVSIFFISPAIVFLATRATFPAAGRAWAKISGDLSYPLYAIHFPIVRVLGTIGQHLHMRLAERIVFMLLGAAGVILSSAVAYVAYDVPIRRVLSRRWLAAGKPG